VEGGERGKIKPKRATAEKVGEEIEWFSQGQRGRGETRAGLICERSQRGSQGGYVEKLCIPNSALKEEE
jgi:hypothetical protein